MTVLRDRRDQRDPEKLGTALLALPKRGKASTRYDRNHAMLLQTPDYDDEGKGIAHEERLKYEAEFPDGFPEGDRWDGGE